MAETLERVYASAIFELSCENDCLTELFDEMAQVNEILAQNEKFLTLLSSPLVSDGDKHNVLNTTFKHRVSDLLFDFLCVVTDKRRIAAFSGIFTEFRNMYNKHMNILEVRVTTAEPMSEHIRKKLIDKLTDVSGSTVILDERVDKALLGGIIIRYDNTEIDSSVRSKLDKIKKQIDSTIA